MRVGGTGLLLRQRLTDFRRVEGDFVIRFELGMSEVILADGSFDCTYMIPKP